MGTTNDLQSLWSYPRAVILLPILLKVNLRSSKTCSHSFQRRKSNGTAAAAAAAQRSRSERRASVFSSILQRGLNERLIAEEVGLSSCQAAAASELQGEE